VTKPIAKRVARALYPDWREVLARASRVESEPLRECFLCGSKQARLERMRSVDEWRCVDVADGCGRRLVKRG